MKTKHTPGEWWLDINKQVLSDPQGNFKICTVHRISPDDGGGANATLIIAAPKMLLTLDSARIALLDALNNLPADSECAQFVRGRLAMVEHTIREATK